MYTDPIADLLTRLRNGLTARQPKVEVPASNVKIEITRLLKSEGYINNYRVADEAGKRTIKLYLRYNPDRTPVATRIERVSKPGRRVYTSATKIPSVIGGMGVNILTTSRGVMTGKQAREAGVGGEILCNIW